MHYIYTSSILTDVEVVDIGLCNENGVTIRDHYAVTSTLKHAMPRAAKKLVNYRKLQSIDIPLFCEDIATSLVNTTTGTVSELTEKYITGLCSILDEHAPLIQRRRDRTLPGIMNRFAMQNASEDA